MEEKERSIGGLWLNEEKHYLRGFVDINGEKKYIIIFKNHYKKDRQPDYRIYLQKPREENQEEITSDEQLPF